MSAPEDNGEAITDINVTPLVDVSLVLVIIFMAVSPLVLQAGIKALQSQSGAAQGKTAAGQNVTLDIDAAGRVTLNGRLMEPQEWPQALEKSLMDSKDRLVSITADPNIAVGTVVEVLDTAKQKGARKLVMIKKPEKIEEIHAGTK